MVHLPHRIFTCLLNVAMIAGAWWLTPYMAEPIMALGWAVVAAGILQLAIQIPELWKKNY